MTTQETSIVFKKVGGHNHDGATSTLIDTTKYSLFDYIPAINATNSTARGRYQLNNQILLKNFIVSTIEERVLNPQGITIKANTISAREIIARTITSTEIAANTITADNLTANLVLINNIIRSSNYSDISNTGWAISHTGDAVFNNAVLRGTIFANSGSIGGWTITSTVLGAGNTALYSNGHIYADNANFVGGTIGGWDIDADRIDAGNTILYSNGYIYAEQGNFKGSITGATGTFSGSLSGASITGATGTFSGTVSVSDGTNGIEITTDGFLKGLGGSGVRVKSVGGETGTQLFGNLITTTEYRGNSFQISNRFDCTGAGTVITTVGNRPLILRRDYVASSKFISFVNTDSSSNVGHVAFANTTHVVYETTSDIRLKDNIEEIKNGIETIKKIIPYSFVYKEAPEAETHGFIAQQVWENYPHPVSVGGDNPKDNPWMIDYSRFTPILMAGLRELIQKVEILEDRLNSIDRV